MLKVPLTPSGVGNGASLELAVFQEGREVCS